MKHLGTAYQFAHHRTVEGERCLIWGNGIGEVLVPVASPEYIEALNSRSLQLNALADEGEQDLLEVYFRTQAKRATMYGRLYNTTPTDTSTLATLAASEEATANGYGPVSWTVGNTDFPTSSLIGGNWKVTSTTKTYTATGAWTAVTNLVLATVGTGTAGLHVAWSALSATRTLANTDTLDVSVSITLD